jgi:nucleotide-binding universal stress UspA family protein
MATTVHPDLPVGPAGVSGALAALERTLSRIASETAVAAESLRDQRGGRPAAPDREVAGWWLDRVVRTALTTRDTCRAARAAIDDRRSSPGEGGSSARPHGAPADASSPSFPTRRADAGRWIVVGYDGSEAAERALLRAADEAGEWDTVVVVTTTARVYSAGPAAEPLLEPSAEPSELLAAAKATVAARTSIAHVVLVARRGDPAEELLEVARAASADLVIVGRWGKDFVARTLLGSVASRVVEQASCDVLVVA